MSSQSCNEFTEDELLLAFLFGRNQLEPEEFSSEAAENITSHLGSCIDCLGKMQEFEKISKDVNTFANGIFLKNPQLVGKQLGLPQEHIDLLVEALSSKT